METFEECDEFEVDLSSSQSKKLSIKERNKIHAKNSRIRKKFYVLQVQNDIKILQIQNAIMKQALVQMASTANIPDINNSLFLDAQKKQENKDSTVEISNPDYRFLRLLQRAQQNFVVTDPFQQDNPIVFASQGFLDLTGYSINEVLGRNCRFLQGPDTDMKAVEVVRQAINRGEDIRIPILNYCKNGATFWNNLFISALRNMKGEVVSFIGVQFVISKDTAEMLVSKN